MVCVGGFTMLSLLNIALLLASTVSAAPKAVFAHFMVGNCKTWSEDQWKADMILAKEAHIDAFALNIANNEGIDDAVATAFKAALAVGFKLFFSFDYAGNGAWTASDVAGMLHVYGSSSSHFQHDGKPLASTFEGPDNATDWKFIKAATSCFFMPDWSSKGARDALALADGVADGLFSWAAWPWGNQDSDTYVDASYLDFLERAGNKPYMMPISPWFYTNMPGFTKNWLWRGDDLWRDRWEQVHQVKPQYIQIISWNDYGESHHIGPLHSDGYEAFAVKRGNPPFNYAVGLPHDGWRALLPWWIDMYKYGTAKISQEIVTAYYRPYPGASTACSHGGTTGNTASQLLLEFAPNQVMQDKIFFSALLTRNASVSVTVGGVAVQAVWTDVPFDQVGVHHGSAVFGSLVGQVKVTVSRSGTVVASITGQAISTACTNGLANWNAITYAAYGPTLSTSTAPSLSIPYQNCTLGRAPGNFAGICDYTCYYGYCPIGACHCLTMGKPRDRPVWTGVKGYPAAGLGSSYGGLCAMACGLGNCMTGACSTVETDLVEPTVSPFLPPACVSGTGTGDFQGLCQYACNWGYCPRNTCTCLVQGILNLPTPDKIPGYKGVARYQTPTDSGLCDFACSRGYCPTGPCVQEGNGNILGCGMDDHEWRPECEVAELSCDFDYHYADLDALYAARRTIQPECLQTHTMQVLYDMLQRTLTWYNEVNLNYDKAFGHYQKHIKSTVQPALDEFMSEYTSPVGAGNKYFTCTWESPRESTIVQKCPIDYDHITYSTFTITYHLDDADGFFEELARTANVLPDWVDLAGWDREDCEQSSCPIINRERYNIPMENSSMVVPNPKDVALLAKPKLDELEIQLGVTYLEMMLGTWEGREDDPAMTLSLPLFMFHDAVSTMAEVKDIGEDAAAAEKKNLILTIVGALLLVIPFLGEAAAVIAGMGNVARIIAIAGIAGNAGLTVYEVIGDPKAAAETAPFVILELLGGRGFRSPKSYRSAASTRTAFNRDGAGKMGPVFRNSDTTLRGAATACKKKLA